MTDNRDEYPPKTTISMLLLLASVIFATACLLTQLWYSGGSEAILQLFNKQPNEPLDPKSYLSWCKLLVLLSQLSIILFYAYLCENHPPFAHSDRFYNMDMYYFLLGIIFLASLFTFRKNENIAFTSTVSEVVILEIQRLKVDGDLNNELHDEPIAEVGEQGLVESTHQSSDEHSEQEKLIAYGNDAIQTLKTNVASIAQNQDITNTNCLLHRNQTDEWKGWMQCVILLYHYFQATDVYNAVRVMITSYIWVTGFGHFSFFYSRKDYSFNRVMRNIWRLNFLVICTSLTLGTPYILYYSCPLHTFYFLMVYAVMRLGQHQNYTRYGLRFKLMVLAFIVYWIWDIKFLHLFETLHFFMGSKPMPGASNGSLYEWYFRTTLDHWSTLLGMIFALNIPITTSFYRILEKRSFSDSWVGKASVAVSLSLIMVAWIRYCLVLDKFSYNTIHPYFSFIPVTAYVYFRNITTTCRAHHLQLLSALGRISLELYILQHHIWLTSNSKTILILLPGQPYLNLLITTMIFVFCSNQAHSITSDLRDMLLHENDHQLTFKSTLYASVIVLFYLLIAVIVEMMKIQSNIFVGTLSFIMGYILYKYITIMTWSSMTLNDGIKVKSDNVNNSQQVVNIVLAGTLAVCFLASIWWTLVSFGSSPRSLLRSECGQFINNGHWVQVECSETTDAQAYRGGNVSAIGVCTGGFIWGWETPPPRSHCTFSRRSSKELITTLKNRQLIFIGDSMMRSLFHSFSTEVGFDEDAGGTAKKHSNFTSVFHDVQIKFIWAPFSMDQINTLRELRMNETHEVVDLIVIGGGSWDLLHRTSNESEMILLNSTLVSLKDEIDKTVRHTRPVVWLSPTRIYDPLLTEEKRRHMTEVKMAWLRNLYDEIGITSAASLHIMGLAYTDERVSESFDGVHYPKSVYFAGAQILSNSFDWLLEGKDDKPTESFAEIGVLSDPLKGLITMTVVVIGLYKFDSLLGLLYFVSSVIQGIRPDILYEDILKTSSI